MYSMSKKEVIDTIVKSSLYTFIIEDSEVQAFTEYLNRLKPSELVILLLEAQPSLVSEHDIVVVVTSLHTSHYEVDASKISGN